MVARHSPRVLILPFPLLAHYLRCATLLQPLREQCEFFMTVGNNAPEDVLRASGVHLMRTPQFAVNEVLAAARSFSFDWLSEASLRKVLEGYVHLIRDVRPQLIIHDASQVGRMAAEICGIDDVGIINGYMSRFYAQPRMLPFQHPARRFEKHCPPGMFSAITRAGEQWGMARVHRAFTKLRREYRLKQTKHYLDEYCGRMTCICDEAAIFPQTNLPHSHTIIGPAYFRAPQPVAAELSVEPQRAKPHVVIALGSSGQFPYGEALARLGDFEFTVIGGSQDLTTCTNVRREPFVDPDRILPAADCVVCHGGNGTIYQALSYGVPVVALPMTFEQQWCAHGFAQRQLVSVVAEPCDDVTLRGHLQNAIATRTDLQARVQRFDLDVQKTAARFSHVVSQRLTTLAESAHNSG